MVEFLKALQLIFSVWVAGHRSLEEVRRALLLVCIICFGRPSAHRARVTVVMARSRCLPRSNDTIHELSLCDSSHGITNLLELTSLGSIIVGSWLAFAFSGFRRDSVSYKFSICVRFLVN